jgi:hypothetical protein
MRYVLAGILLIAIAMPASAAPKASASRSATTKSAPAAKRERRASHGHSRDLGGIHPLVGSGEY